MNLNEILKDERGRDLVGPDRSAFTVRSALVCSLIETPESLYPISTEDRLTRYQIYRKIHSAGDTVELSADEIAFVKNCVAALYNTPLMTGMLFEHLDGKVTAPA